MNIQIVLLSILAALVIIAFGLIVWIVVLRLRSHNLKSKFGPEYDYTLEKAGDRKTAELELQGREQRIKDLDIHPLTTLQKDRYHQEWIEIQASFIDDPLKAAEMADRAIIEVMVARGFPVEEFEERAEDISVLYPEFVPGYREANSIVTKNNEDGVSTEDLRQAMVKFHSLFDKLIDFVHQPERLMEVAA
jgi:hypothetical protein